MHSHIKYSSWYCNNKESDMKATDAHYPDDVNGSRTSVRVETANVYNMFHHDRTWLECI